MVRGLQTRQPFVRFRKLDAFVFGALGFCWAMLHNLPRGPSLHRNLFPYPRYIHHVHDHVGTFSMLGRGMLDIGKSLTVPPQANYLTEFCSDVSAVASKVRSLPSYGMQAFK